VLITIIRVLPRETVMGSVLLQLSQGLFWLTLKENNIDWLRNNNNALKKNAAVSTHVWLKLGTNTSAGFKH